MSNNINQVSIDKLRFDPLNPRLPKSVREGTDSEVITHMVVHETLLDLVASIAEQGFFSGEPLLVIADTNDDGNFIVVEGNRRLAALKLLNDPTLTKRRPNAVADIISDSTQEEPPKEAPVLVYPNRESLLDYLGYRHITGIDAWDSLAKARYLTQLKDFHKDEYKNSDDLHRHLAKKIGSRSDYVKKLLNGFYLYQGIEENDFYDIEGLSEKSFKFSLLTTAVSYRNVSNFINFDDESDEPDYNKERLKDLTEYLFKVTHTGHPRIPDSRDLKTFSRVVGSDIAYETFVSGKPLNEAEIYTDGPMKAFEEFIDRTLQDIRGARDTSSKLREIDTAGSLIETLGEIELIAQDLQQTIRIRLNRAKKKVD